jgi:hypothetical protein
MALRPLNKINSLQANIEAYDSKAIVTTSIVHRPFNRFIDLRPLKFSNNSLTRTLSMYSPSRIDSYL